MDKELTIFELIHYEMPKCTKLPLTELTQHKSSWGIPKYTQTKIFESSTAHLMLRHCYKDTSRDQQIDFLKKSGAIQTNKQKSKSLNRMLGFLPTPKGSQRSLGSRKSVRKANSFLNKSSQPPSSSGSKRPLQFSFAPIGRINSYLARISKN